MDQPLVTPALLRNIVGQAVFQLGVMYTLVSRGDAIFGVPAHSALGGAPSEHYTIVFNTFVLLQLFNQVRCLPRIAAVVAVDLRYNDWQHCSVHLAGWRARHASLSWRCRP